MACIKLKRRAEVRRGETAIFRRWSTRDGRLAVVEVQSLYGLPRRFLAVAKLDNGNESILGRHRLRSRAVGTLERKGKA